MAHETDGCLGTDSDFQTCEGCGRIICTWCHQCPNEAVVELDLDEVDDGEDAWYGCPTCLTSLEFCAVCGTFACPECHECEPSEDGFVCDDCGATESKECDVCESQECIQCHDFRHKKPAPKRKRSSSTSSDDAPQQLVSNVSRGVTSTIRKDCRRLGVATWNVAHFGITPASLTNQVYALQVAVEEYRGAVSALEAVRPEKDTKKFDAALAAHKTRLQTFDTRIAALREKLGSTFPELGDDERPAKRQASKRAMRWAAFDAEAKEALRKAELIHLALGKKDDAVDRERHKTLVSRAIIDLFLNNKWLDVLILQEVNRGMDRLKADLAKARLSLYSGPMMWSYGGEEEEHAHDQSDDDVGEKGRGQREYYPVVLRDRAAIRYTGWRAIHTDGTIDDETDPIRWNKREGTYRPVIVHDLMVSSRDVHIGVVHTSPGALPGQPGDHEFFRPNEFRQVEKALAKANGARWIIGGDFYLSREARVVEPSDVFEDPTFESLLARRYGDTLQLYEMLAGRDRKSYGRQYNALKKAAKAPTEEKYRALLNCERSTKQGRLGDKLVSTNLDDFLRNVLDFTFAANLPDHLALLQSVSGTNWHGHHLKEAAPQLKLARARYWAVARIADFFLHTKDWRSAEIGMFHPDGGVLTVDALDLRFSRQWYRLADHFPVGGVFSLDPDDPAVPAIFRLADNAGAEAVDLQKRRIQKRLDNLAGKAAKRRVDLSAIDESLTGLDRIKAIEDLLDLPQTARTELPDLHARDFEPVR